MADQAQMVGVAPQDFYLLAYVKPFWQNFLKVLYRHCKVSADLARVASINTLDSEGRAGFIHSGTYEELTDAFRLTGAHIAEAIGRRVKA